MCEILDSSGVKDTDWGEIGDRLGMDPQTLGNVFFEGWSEHDSPPSWEKLATGLGKMPESCYKNAVVKCRNNIGMFSVYTKLVHLLITVCCRIFYFYIYIPRLNICSTLLTIGKLNTTTWCEFVQDAGLKSSECIKIAEKLGFEVECHFSANDLLTEWGDDASWVQLADALGTIDEYSEQSQKVNKETGL